MDNKASETIRIQEELIAGLEKQLAADQALIDIQKQQIQAQQKKISCLEKKNRTLMETGNGLAAANERLDRICMEQQKVLEAFSGLFEKQGECQP